MMAVKKRIASIRSNQKDEIFAYFKQLMCASTAEKADEIELQLLAVSSPEFRDYYDSYWRDSKHNVIGVQLTRIVL